MDIVIQSARKLGYADYAAIPKDGMRHEIIDGEHYVNAAPNTKHQSVSVRLVYQLYTKVQLAGHGQIFSAPYDVQFSEHNIVQPDIVVVLNANANIIRPSRIKGSPDLVVEILSPSSTDYDRTTKKDMFECHGVHEYWVVDAYEENLAQFVLRDGRYERTVVEDFVRAVFMPGLEIKLAEIW